MGYSPWGRKESDTTERLNNNCSWLSRTHQSTWRNRSLNSLRTAVIRVFMPQKVQWKCLAEQENILQGGQARVS